MDAELRIQVRAARKTFISMAATYALGVFNDSFFRQGVVLLAIVARDAIKAGTGTAEDGMAVDPAWVFAIFTVPYLLLAWLAGWMADRFPKWKIVIGAKALELVAMSLGAVALLTGSWPLLLAMVFLMGAQSCLFGPALNGSIPELYPEKYVRQANSLLNLAVKPAILAGGVLAGIALDTDGRTFMGADLGKCILAAVIVSISAVGLAMSIGAPRRLAANPQARVPRRGPWDTIRQVAGLRRDRMLWLAAVADVFIWSAGAILMILIPEMAIDQFGWSMTTASFLVGAELVGLAIGGVLSNYVSDGKRWYRSLAPSAAGFGLMMIAIGFLPELKDHCIPLPFAIKGHAGVQLSQAVAFGLLGLAGILGGLFIVPTASFIQVRSPSATRGTVLAAVSFATFAGIMVAAAIKVGLVSLLTDPTRVFVVLGALSIAMAVYLQIVLPRAASREEPSEG